MSAAISSTQKLVQAPVLSDNPTSPEALMGREAKKLVSQAQTDSTFDDKIERFTNQRMTLTSVAVVLFFFGIHGYLVRHRRR